MRIDVHRQSIFLTQAVRDHIERRLEFALERFSRRIIRVAVHVAETNGPRGGIDKRCRLIVILRFGEQVVVEEEGDDLYAVIDHAAERAGHTVCRKIQRRRTLRA